MRVIRRATNPAVALETTLLVHGVPPDEAPRLADDLSEAIRAGGANPAIVGVVRGRPIAGLDADELSALLRRGGGGAAVPKVNASNLDAVLAQRGDGATTVSATSRIAAAAGIRVFATGGIGGVHRGFAERLDVSADLASLAAAPVAVVCSGAKSLLDVASTREALETLGVPVIGWRTDELPAFYTAASGLSVDARCDEVGPLAGLVARVLAAGRGVLVVRPPPADAAIGAAAFAGWLAEAERASGAAAGRDATPAVLAALHRVSGGATLACNLALARANASLAGELATALAARLGSSPA